MAMTYKNFAVRLVAAMLTAAGFAACSNTDNAHTVPPATNAGAPTDFSAFAENAFAQAANSTPATINGVNFTDDVNDEPDAFAALIASGSYQ
jgi:hypothetical protein